MIICMRTYECVCIYIYVCFLHVGRHGPDCHNSLWPVANTWAEGSCINLGPRKLQNTPKLRSILETSRNPAVIPMTPWTPSRHRLTKHSFGCPFCPASHVSNLFSHSFVELSQSTDWMGVCPNHRPLRVTMTSIVLSNTWA